MKQWTAVAAALALVAMALAPAAFAGGAKCAEQHTQASYEQMTKKLAAKGYLGIETEKVGDGRYAVTSIATGSPAEKAGFQKGDVLVALNGTRFGDANQDAVMKAKATLGPGKAATYTVARGASEQQLTAVLAEVPREILAKWVGEHVVDHAGYQIAAKN